MKFLILAENSNGPIPHMHYRALGTMELRRRAEAKGHKAEIIEWFTRWTLDELKLVIQTYQPDVIGLSITLMSDVTADAIKQNELLSWARGKYPKLKVIVGGVRDEKESDGLIDAFFLGRSMKMFDDWLDDKDMTSYTVSTEPFVYLNKEFNEFTDQPILPIPKDEDYYTPHDILGFEVSVGCKFNCSFCNYELRNAKITNLSKAENLHSMFKNAYEKYGITHFYAVDDTLNESDEKLEIIADAIKGLDFHPQISGWLRLDLISARPYQLELLQRIQMQSIFFGIESFNEEASKRVRKRSIGNKPFETLKKIKELCPDTWTTGGLIVGLTGDTEESIRKSVHKAMDENLLSEIRFQPLGIHLPSKDSNKQYLSHFNSDLDNDPGKFNYQIIESAESEYEWKNEWTTYTKAKALASKLRDELNSVQLGHSEYSSMNALKLYKKCTTYDEYASLRHRTRAKADLLKQSYVDKKLQYFLKL
tara:strand:- start:78 stop:1511 length:1434 start_codon:yes stop_codon:yes gene_type:complete